MDPHFFVNLTGSISAKRLQAYTEPGDRLVAELTFGFWSSLLTQHYDAPTPGGGFWPYLLRPVFPHVPKHLRTRVQILKRIDQIRHFRNRVFHHETIWYFDQSPDKKNLCLIHDEILEAIGWISPEMERVLKVVDGFAEVCDSSYLAKIKEMLGNELDNS